jgi:hypothetical protein
MPRGSPAGRTVLAPAQVRRNLMLLSDLDGWIRSLSRPSSSVSPGTTVAHAAASSSVLVHVSGRHDLLMLFAQLVLLDLP